MPASAQRGKVHDLEIEVSDPALFLQPLKMVGRSFGLQLYFVNDAAECDPPEPHYACLPLNPPPAATNFNLTDSEKLVVPGKTFRDALVFVLNQRAIAVLRNSTGTDHTGIFSLRNSIVVESSAFLDPRARDYYGNPLNGRIVLPLSSAGRGLGHTLHPNDYLADRIDFSRMYVVSRGIFTANFQIPDDLIDRFFDQDITLSLSMSGSVTMGDYPSASAYFIVLGH